MRAKQVIVVRGDLNFGTRGKLVAQCCHASLGSIFSDSFTQLDGEGELLSVAYDDELRKWFTEKFTKIVVKCQSEQELLDLAKQCEEKMIRHALIKDAGDTVFKEPTNTCLGIGPCDEETINKITGHLKLL
jgi:PTH2 family peptidyl-tRNA hydrolase